jgi:MoaA/NifB/PqqE/SkfB family radical SAM enzyme
MTGNTPPDAGSVDSNHLTKGLLRLTMACNEQCQFCNLPVEDEGTEAMDGAEAKEAVKAFAASGQRTLTLSGGEPTLLRKGLVDLVTMARAAGIPFVELQTNGVLVDGRYASELGSAGLTSAFVALLSHEPAIHDELMGRSGAHAACLAGIDGLLNAGIHVTLNPVVTHSMQSLVADYVSYVAERLPEVTSLSLSVVQPHGRAAAHLDLLPDYEVLGHSVRLAQGRAEDAGIELLNPYCGLPLCVGWEQATERCVEAVEAIAARHGDHHGTPGLVNRGDKRQGEPCRCCGLRTRCGGAWHAYWDHRGGRGLHPPALRIEPWEAQARSAPAQTIVHAQDGLTDAGADQLEAATTPTVWLVTQRLSRGDGLRIGAAGCTDLALISDPQRWSEGSETVREVRRIARRNEALPPQLRLGTALGLEPDGSFEKCYGAVRLAAAIGVDAIRILAPPTSRWARFIAAVHLEHDGLDVAMVEGQER